MSSSSTPPESDLKAPAKLHRGEWGTACWLSGNLCRIRLKNQLGVLMVNTYVWREEATGELVVADPGWPWTLDALGEAMRACGILEEEPLSAVTRWLYTHAHIDHMGAAALLEDRSDAPHHIFKEVLPELGAWHSFQDRMNGWDDWVLGLLAEPAREQVRQERAAIKRRPTMVSAYGERRVTRAVPFELGERLSFGSLVLEVHDASGHDPHHVAFLEPTSRWCLSGDVVIGVPTPITEVMGDNLERYEATLDRLEGLAPRALLPGHGTQVLGQQRALEALRASREHVTRYRQSVRAAMSATHAPIDLWSLCEQLAAAQQLSRGDTRWWVHFALVRSHLLWLIARGEVEQVELASGPHYISL